MEKLLAPRAKLKKTKKLLKNKLSLKNKPKRHSFLVRKTRKMNNNPYVIASIDEGIQLNAGIRLGFIGGGLGLEGATQALEAWKKVVQKAQLDTSKLYLLSSQEDEWQDEAIKSRNINIISTKMKKWAKEIGAIYAGQLEFGDPREYISAKKEFLGVRGHLVRPPKIHVATGITLTCGGGEENFDLRNYVISADWLLGMSDKKLATKILQTEVEYCRNIAKRELPLQYDLEGAFGQKIAEQNHKLAQKILG